MPQLRALLEPYLPYILPVVLATLAGLVGTMLEALGTRLRLPALVAVGQRIEAAFADLPKLVRGSRYTKVEAVLAGPDSTHRSSVNPPPLAVLGLVLGCCCMFTGCALFGSGSGSKPTTPEERRERAEHAADVVKQTRTAVNQGLGVLKDACLTYLTYRGFLPKTEPEVDVLCERLVEPPKLEPAPAPPASSAPPSAPPASEGGAGGRLAFVL